MSKTFFQRLKAATSAHEAFTLKKIMKKRQHKARLITLRTRAGKPARAEHSNSRAFRANIQGLIYGHR